MFFNSLKKTAGDMENRQKCLSNNSRKNEKTNCATM